MAAVPDNDGVRHAYLGVLSHQGRCSQTVHSLLKDFSKSKHGRFRPVTEVLADLKQLQGAVE